jgi:FkbM family methyltransferase
MTGFSRLRNIFVKRSFRSFGLDVTQIKNVPRETLAGLRRYPIRTVIDCGANRGQFARYISGFFPKADIFCFEPLAQPFKTLSVWAAAQQGRVECFNTALGDSSGTTIMHHHLNHDSSSSLLRATEYEVKSFPGTSRQTEVNVPVTTLDAALCHRNLAPDILLKLDVQGFEDRVLRGARKLLGQVRACVIEVDVDPLYESQARFKDLVLLLNEYGLSYAGNLDQACAENGRIMWLDAVFVRDCGDSESRAREQEGYKLHEESNVTFGDTEHEHRSRS